MANNAKTAVNVVTVLVWIISLSLLIWFCVVQFRKLQHSSVVTTEFFRPGSITYPGMFICPATETVNKALPDGHPMGVRTTFGAQFIPYKPYDHDDSDRGYYVCPRVVYFTTPDDKLVQCLDFQQTPVFNASVTAMADQPTCPTTNEQSYWYKSSTMVPDPVGGVWTATQIGNSLYFDFQSDNFTAEPYMLLLYSGSSILRPPATVQDYINIFSITNFFLAHIPLQSYSALNVDKIVTDDWPSDDSCDKEGWLSAVLPLNAYPVVPGTVYSGLILGFDILEEVKTCHAPVVGATDVLGIVGGGIAFILAATIALQMGVQKLFGDKTETSSSGGNNVQSSSYRPLGSDGL